MAPRTHPLAIAALALALAWLGQFLTVHYNYHGNWTALFCTGSRRPVPAILAGENVYQFPNSRGYDGQLYHYMAHDPLFRRGMVAFMDAPAQRYRRILVPGLAWLLALGRDSSIDRAYFAVVLAFVFLGAYWLSRWVSIWGYHPAWGLLFLVVPSVVTSLDRELLDGPFAALVVAFVLYVHERAAVKLWLVLAAALLTRETGVCLVAAYCTHVLFQRDFRRGVMFASAALPAAAWYGFVHFHAPEGPLEITLVPFRTYLYRLVHPIPAAGSLPVRIAAQALDYLALAGMLAALWWVFRMLRDRRTDPPALAAYGFTLIMAVAGKQDLWTEVYGFGRILGVLPILIALDGVERRSWPRLFPVASLAPRIVLEIGGQVAAVARGLTGL